MSFKVYYRTWSTATNAPVDGDRENHVVIVHVENGETSTDVTIETDDITGIGAGDYETVLTDEQLPPGARWKVQGASSTGDVYIFGESGIRPRTIAQLQAGLATAAAVADKTGYKLASDGLDSVSTTAPTGPASNFREMLVQTWRRFFKRTTRDDDEIKTFADDNTTVITTQEYTSADPDEDIGAAA